MTQPESRRSLPLLPGHTGRSALTCIYRCGNACAHPVPNTSGNAYFGDLMANALKNKAASRRGVLRAGALGAVVASVGVGGALATGSAAAAPRTATSGGGLTFTPVPPNTNDVVTVADGYSQGVVAAWGDPILPGAPAFDFENQTAAAQAEQFGYNCDFVHMLPISHDRALLWVNHEYTDEVLMFRGYTDGASATAEQMKIAMAAHGGSVVEIERVGDSGQWHLVTRGRRRFNRRITAATPMRFSGPAAGHELLRTAADKHGREVLGMLNNCAGGVTPWGTILTCEENFNQYFVGGDGVPEADKPALERYGISTTTRIPSDSRRWERIDERFDLTEHPHEANRFGWVVEIDPFDPKSTPVKHTALGRVKHEAATTTLAEDGRVVVYMGDDERFDYIYKYVSKGRYRDGSRRHNRDLLTEGTLYVAKFTGDSPAGEIDGSGTLPGDGAFDGSGEWIPLVSGDKSYVPGMSAAEVLVHTRLAGDKAGATKMDRPEDMERNPKTGAVYVALTKNTNRAPGQADEANPRGDNKDGHVLELVEEGNDAGATRFAWSVPLLCGDPEDPSTYFAGFDKSQVSPISCPDNVAFDRAGNLWISTDGNTLGAHDGLFAVPVEGDHRGHVRQFLSMPVGAETCGPMISEDQRTVFVAVQHPGEVDDATPDNPASHWPEGGSSQPRPAVISVWHTQNAKIGT